MAEIGLVGRKCGMTQIYVEGVSSAVTVLEVYPNRIVQIKNEEKDGYNAIQVTTDTQKAERLSKPEAGHFAKAGVLPGKGLWEFSVVKIDQYAVGAELKVDLFSVGEKVDVTSTSKGKGFAGTIKRHRFAAQDATHGNSLSHRVPGSIGQRQSPGKVFKGKKMPGQMGNIRCTVLSQKIVRLDLERNLIFIAGSVPGAAGSYVIIRSAIKGKNKERVH